VQARLLDTGAGPIALAGLTGFRDFDSVLASSRLAARLKRPIAAADLPLPGSLPMRDLYATDLARRFENSEWLAQACAAWRPSLVGVRHLGLPAVLGFRNHGSVITAIEESLELTVFEIPTLPPCLPGLRLEAVLREACLACGVDVIEGAPVVGRVDGRTRTARAAGVQAQTAGGPRVINAGAVLLATGDLLHGGLVARQNGRVQESVFDLPVVHSNDRSTWTALHLSDPQPYTTFGLRVDTRMRPLGADGAPLLQNLFAAGGLLAGARRAEEGSRQGIGLATAWRAVESALA
jgi:glycerol-3-phosphate dehydrogenase subunit B